MKKKHTAADILFRHFHTVSNNINKKFKENINNFLKAELNVMKIMLIQVRSKSSAD